MNKGTGHSEAKRAENAARQTERRKTQGPHGDQGPEIKKRDMEY